MGYGASILAILGMACQLAFALVVYPVLSAYAGHP
jgi:hypothetical protein